MHGTPEDFTSRGACLCMRLLAFIRMPIEAASLNTRSTSFRDLIRLLSCRPRWAGKLEQSQTLIPGRSRAAAASMVAAQAAGWMYEPGKGLLQLYCVGWSTFASSFGCAGMLFWWAPWHGGVAGIRQDGH